MSLTDQEVRQHMWWNTISNYVCVALRLIMGLVMFRLLIEKLPTEDFGFWALIWSIFGYGVLLDFGFGFTAQKRVAELSVHGKWEELSKVLSTIFFTYLLIGGTIMVVGAVSSHWLIDMFQVTPENRERFRELLVYFFVGLGLAFPLGLFPEMLRGLQRIALANYTLLAGMTLNFVLAAIALYNGWGLKVLLLIALGCTFAPDLVCGFFAKKHLREVKIVPRFFSRDMIRQTVSFSFFAYVITVSNIILTKTDLLVIGSMVAVSAVALYQPGAKIAEMFFAFTQQLPETLSPAAAHHHAQGAKARLRELLVNGTRFSLMISTPLYCLCALFMEGILRMLAGEEHLTTPVYWTAQILLLWIYMMVVTQSVSKRIFVMSGHERRLMWLSVGEAVLNLGLSIGLVLWLGEVWCVALASLVATTFFGWFYMWPWAASEAAVSGLHLARKVLLPTWLACVPLIGVALAFRALPLMLGSGAGFPGETFSFPAFFVEGMVAFIVAFVGVWWLAMRAEEREQTVAFLGRLLGQRAMPGSAPKD